MSSTQESQPEPRVVTHVSNSLGALNSDTPFAEIWVSAQELRANAPIDLMRKHCRAMERLARECIHLRIDRKMQQAARITDAMYAETAEFLREARS